MLETNRIMSIGTRTRKIAKKRILQRQLFDLTAETLRQTAQQTSLIHTQTLLGSAANKASLTGREKYHE